LFACRSARKYTMSCIDSQSEGKAGFRSGSKCTSTIGGGAPPARPDIVAKSTESGLYEFVNDFRAVISQQVRALCAAGESLATQQVGRERFNQDSKPESVGKRAEEEV